MLIEGPLFRLLTASAIAGKAGSTYRAFFIPDFTRAAL
jgi:hypothetical protein